MLGPQSSGMQTYSFPNFTGGWTFTQAQDSDCVAFENVEMLRDKYICYRRGIAKLNSTSLGTGQVVGIGVVSGNDVSGTSFFLIVAKAGTTFYYANAALTSSSASFSTFTVPTLAVGTYTDTVRFLGTQDASGNNYFMMCHPGWATVMTWDGVVSTATAVKGSPCAKDLAWCNGRVYAVGTNCRTLWFSDAGDPSSWPATNNFDIKADYGAIRRILPIEGKLYIFCTNGILYLEGDPATNFYVGVAHPSVGLSTPSSLAIYGNEALFEHAGTIYHLSGSGGVAVVSDALRDMGVLKMSAAAMSPYYYMLRPATSSGAEVRAYERIRYGMWSRWTYGATTSFGTGTVTHPCACYIDGGGTVRGFVFNGGDGSLYLQRNWTSSDADAYGNVDPVPDAPAVPVRVRIQTRMGDVGDHLLTKQWRRISFYGTGDNFTMTVNTSLNDGTILATVVEDGSGGAVSLPKSFTSAVADDWNCEYQQIQLDFSADNMFLQDLSMDWRPIRYNLLDFD